MIIAAGICPFAWRPGEFSELPSQLVSHSSENIPFSRFHGKKVAVVGGGQSALESAALLAEHGVEVDVLIRGGAPQYLGWRKRIKSLGPLSRLFYFWTDVGPAGISNIVSLPALLQLFPRGAQDYLRKRSIRPAGAGWLRPRLERVRLNRGKTVTAARPAGEQLRLTLDDGSERVVDHLLLGTGYRIDVSRYRFLSSDIIARLKTSNGFPQLGTGFESSVPGLHFLGAQQHGAMAP